MALTLNYKGSQSDAPAKTQAAPKGTSAWDAIFAVTGSADELKKLWKVNVAALLSDKGLVFATKSGLLVHEVALLPSDLEALKLIPKGSPPIQAAPNFKAKLKKAMHDAFLKSQTFVANAAEAKPAVKMEGPSAAVAAEAAKALNIEFATGQEPVVKLRNATKMYQPVGGTEDTSRYFVVAMTEDLKFAARLLHNNLSIRVEGPGLKKHATRLSAAGFSKFETDYASVHLKTMGDKVLAQKTLGAVLFGLGLQIKTPWPDVHKCEGK